VTLNAACIVENTAYIAYGRSGEFIDIVSRYALLLDCNVKFTDGYSSGNCQPNLYCDSQQKVCMQTKVLGAACSADKELVPLPWCLEPLS